VNKSNFTVFFFSYSTLTLFIFFFKPILPNYLVLSSASILDTSPRKTLFIGSIIIFFVTILNSLIMTKQTIRESLLKEGSTLTNEQMGFIKGGGRKSYGGGSGSGSGRGYGGGSGSGSGRRRGRGHGHGHGHGHGYGHGCGW
jgi:hypothetical protein